MRVTTRIVPVTLEYADALLEGDDAFESRFRRPVAPGYLDFPDVLAVMRDALANGTPPEWYSHLIVDGDGTVVGFGGYKGPPVDGEVEIGYSVAPGHQRRGHASAAVQRFVDAARERGVAVVSAHTLPQDNPSTRLLARAGFTMTEVVVDEEIGDVWRWELRLAP